MVVSSIPRASAGLTAPGLLILRLRDFRHTRANADNVSIYSVFPDTVLRTIAQDRPTSLEALTAIRGFPSGKSAEYGPEILRLVRTTPAAASGTGGTGGAGGGVRLPSSGLRRALLRKLTSSLAGGKRAPRPTAPKHELPSAFIKKKEAVAGDDDQIYILELIGGRVYVGRTSCLDRRMSQHRTGRGSGFTQAFPPTGVLLPRLGHVSGSAEAAERDETLRYMYLRGITMVRGWKYTRVEMAPEEEQDAEANIRELFDLCRRCGLPGHFVGQCRSGIDRFGRPLFS